MHLTAKLINPGGISLIFNTVLSKDSLEMSISIRLMIFQKFVFIFKIIIFHKKIILSCKKFYFSEKKIYSFFKNFRNFHTICGLIILYI